MLISLFNKQSYKKIEDEYLTKFEMFYTEVFLPELQSNTIIAYINDNPVYLHDLYLYTAINEIYVMDENSIDLIEFEKNDDTVKQALFNLIDDNFRILWCEKLDTDFNNENAISIVNSIAQANINSEYTNISIVETIRTKFKQDFLIWYNGLLAHSTIQYILYPHDIANTDEIIEYWSKLLDDESSNYTIVFTNQILNLIDKDDIVEIFKDLKFKIVI